jgi:predicted aspartyl protease
MLVACGLPAPLLAQEAPKETLQKPSEPVVVPALADAQTPPMAPPSIFQDVDLDRSRRMRVPVTVNAKGPFYFLVDTGSEATVISNELAGQLALLPERTIRVASMTGATDNPAYRLDQLQFSSLVMQGLLAAGLDQKGLGAAGIIGIDTLQKHKVIFDFRTQQMEILPAKRVPKSRAKQAEARDGVIVVEATRRLGRLILSNATIAGRKVDLVVDTGAQTSVGNIALRDALLAKGQSRGTDTVLSSVTGALLPAQSAVIPRIRIGGMDFTNIPVHYADGYAFRVLKLQEKPAMLLGMDTLQLFDRIEVDFANRRVSFTLPAGGSQARRTDRLAASR